FSGQVKSDEVAPTSNSIMIATTFSGALSFFVKSYLSVSGESAFTFVKMNYSLLMFVGAFSTALIRKQYQHQLSDRRRKSLVAALLVFLILRILWQLLES